MSDSLKDELLKAQKTIQSQLCVINELRADNKRYLNEAVDTSYKAKKSLESLPLLKRDIENLKNQLNQNLSVIAELSKRATAAGSKAENSREIKEQKKVIALLEKELLKERLSNKKISSEAGISAQLIKKSNLQLIESLESLIEEIGPSKPVLDLIHKAIVEINKTGRLNTFDTLLEQAIIAFDEKVSRARLKK